MNGLRRALLLGIATLITYCWMVRLGNDLVWDEALNFKTYARHPLTAIGLYHEPNNHPLESLLKSLFFRGLGWDQPSFFRFTGFLLVVGWLALAWTWFRRFERKGSLVAATAIVLAMLLSRAPNFQATALRGYFLSMLLQFFYLLQLDRDLGWLDEPAPDPAAPDPRRGSRRPVIRYGILGALILFAVPSNIVAMPALWLLTAGALAPPGSPWHRRLLPRSIAVAGATLAFTLILYAPILAGLAAGISSFHGTPETAVADVPAAVLAEARRIFRHMAPRGCDAIVFGVALGMLVVLVLALRRRSRVTWLALAAAASCVLMRLVAAAFVEVPGRIESSLTPPIAMAIVAWIHALAAGRSARAQNVVAILLTLGCYATIPHIVSTEPFYRGSSTMAEFVRAYARPEGRDVLVAHAGIEDAIPYLERVLPPARTVSGLAELNERIAPAPAPPRDSWDRRLRDLVLGRREVVPIDLSAIDVLVLVESNLRATGAFSWAHPGIEAVKSRLSRVSRFSVGHYRLMVFEAP